VRLESAQLALPTASNYLNSADELGIDLRDLLKGK
jgi:hypothetical protein